MAEGFLREYLKNDKNLSANYEVASAGIAAQPGEPASINAIKVMKDIWNIDLSGHRASRLTKEIVENAFLILTMSQSHKNLISSIFKDCSDKIFTLKEHVKIPELRGLDIHDPFGLSLAEYESCAKEINLAVQALVKLL